MLWRLETFPPFAVIQRMTGLGWDFRSLGDRWGCGLGRMGGGGGGLGYRAPSGLIVWGMVYPGRCPGLAYRGPLALGWIGLGDRGDLTQSAGGECHSSGFGALRCFQWVFLPQRRRGAEPQPKGAFPQRRGGAEE